MQVYVKLYATFRLKYKDYDVPGGICLELPPGSTIADAMQALEIQPEKVSLLRKNEVITKDIHAALAEGDVLEVFPYVGGG